MMAHLSGKAVLASTLETHVQWLRVPYCVFAKILIHYTSVLCAALNADRMRDRKIALLCELIKLMTLFALLRITCHSADS